MVTSNLLSLEMIRTIADLNDSETTNSFLKMYDDGYDMAKDKAAISSDELSDISAFYKKLCSAGIQGEKTQGYILGCEIHIGATEQFDLLRFSHGEVLNLEMKHSLPSKGVDGIRNQLLKHKHYLSILKKDVKLFTFVRSSETLYRLENDQIKTVFIDDLVNSIGSDYITINPLNNLNEADFLISPYNNPIEFSQHQYFLNDDQIEISRKLEKCKTNNIALIGGPGTGKTLLLLDWAKKYTTKHKNVILIFSSNINNNHSLLAKKMGITIKAIKELNNIDFNKFDVILLDEAQRLTKSQVRYIQLSNKNKICIYSLDKQQTLHPTEDENNIQDYVLKLSNVTKLDLKEKVRSNPSLSSFIKKLFDRKARNVQPYPYSEVQMVYFENKVRAAVYISNLVKNHNYVSIEFTPYKTKSFGNIKMEKIIDDSMCVHEVIGQEFDNIIVPLDESFEYDENDRLIFKNQQYYPYLEMHMLFESVTRVKRKLLIVVVNNTRLYQKIQEILTWKEDRSYGRW